MKASLQKLVRLHALRSELAEAALNHTRQIDAELRDTASGIRLLQSAAATESSGFTSVGGHSTWHAYRACRDVAFRLQTTTEQRMLVLQEQRQAAFAAQQTAVIAREQMAKLAEHCRTEIAEQANRREQSRLDEAHAAALFRKTMPTRF